MAEFQTVLVVIAVCAGVLGIAFFATYEFNKAVRPSGR